MCLTLNSAAEWAGSIFQVVVAEVVVAGDAVMVGICSFQSLGCGREIFVATTIFGCYTVGAAGSFVASGVRGWLRFLQTLASCLRDSPDWIIRKHPEDTFSHVLVVGNAFAN